MINRNKDFDDNSSIMINQILDAMDAFEKENPGKLEELHQRLKSENDKNDIIFLNQLKQQIKEN